jgi:mannan endo-1,4-beta-mannosidase
MKKLTLACGLLAICIFFQACISNESEANKPVNADATPEARQLLSFLYSIEGEKLLTGQHNYGHELTRSTDSIYAYTGKYPAIWGADVGGNPEGERDFIQVVIDEAIRQHEKGSIITLMYHQVKPFHHDSLGFSKSVKGRVTDEEWEAIVTPGTEYHEMWLEKIDIRAGYLRQLQDKNIPVLWRPYHEMNGVWFWYGDRKGREGLQKLWKMMYDRYVNHHQLHNLIWVWNANAPRDWENDEAFDYALYFPGLDYVDILAADIYKNDFKQSHHDVLDSLAAGKLIALGEVGKLPTTAVVAEQAQWVWFMDWARFPWEANTTEDVRALYNDPKCVTLDELVEIYPQH